MQLLFDLDGTLADSRLGVTRCIAHALIDAGVVVPPDQELTPYVGPPLPGSFATLLGTSDAQQIERAISIYRSRFEQVGMVENSLFPGISPMLEAFEAAGHDLFVITAKPRPYAVQILKHFGIDGMFQVIHGPELGAREYSKASLIRDVCLAGPVVAHHAVMIGDRGEDVRGAKDNGVRAVAVAWGYGEREELEAAEPDRIVESCDELAHYIGTQSNPRLQPTAAAASGSRSG